MTTLSLAVLRAREENLKALIRYAEQAEVRRAGLQEYIKKNGISDADIRAVLRPSRAKRGFTYQHPADTNKRWSGRGARPIWLKQELANGASLDTFRVNNQPQH